MLNSYKLAIATIVGMYNYYICDMGDHNLNGGEPGIKVLNKDTEPLMPEVQNTNTTTVGNLIPSEDAELRKRVDARTEYLNSIKLQLS